MSEKEKVDPFADIIDRLEKTIAEMIDLGEKMDIDVDVQDVLDVIDRAIFKADGEGSEGPEGSDAKAYYLDSMYEELQDKALNLFEIKHDSEGVAQHVPISVADWKTCLEKLRVGIVQGLLSDEGGDDLLKVVPRDDV